jgi:dimethylargininase
LKFTGAIVRPPGANFADGLTTVDLGKPDYELALRQHDAYSRALERCGLSLTRLKPDERYPDSTFVEDTAVLTKQGAVITRPGESSRLGEIEEIKGVLREHFAQLGEIREPGTLDGGDVCEAGNRFFIGISQRTNEAGATQLAGFLLDVGYQTTLIDIRSLSNILHLKSGLTWLGGNRVLAIHELKDLKELAGYDLVQVNTDEVYAANCLLINGRVLIPAGYPVLRRELEKRDYETIELEMSEFQKMDGGLSCLSLRF